MRVLGACSLGGAGHLRPLAPFLHAARRRGDEVLVVGPPALQEMVEDEGLAFVAGGEPREEAIAPIRERLAVAPAAEAAVLGNRELFGRLAADAMLSGVERVVSDFAPDLIVRDPAEFASAVVARRRAISVAQVAISLADVEMGSIAVAAPALERFGADVPDSLRTQRYLSRFPAALDPSPFPTTLRYHEASRDDPAPLADWWHGSNVPLVYVTFGTVLGYMTLASSVFRTAIRAVALLDARVLLTVGRKFDPVLLGAVPGHVHVEPWVDQADVLAVADVVVCHGGSGTVYGSLAAGVPLVVVPVFADQFENARRVAAAGAGLTVDVPNDGSHGRTPIGGDDVPRITAAIEQVLAEPRFRDRALEIAAESAGTPTVDDALDTLTRRR